MSVPPSGGRVSRTLPPAHRVGSKFSKDCVMSAAAGNRKLVTNCKEYQMNTPQQSLSTILSRLLPADSSETPASGITAVELNAEQLDRVSGGRAAVAARAGTTCSPCADDCGY